MLDSDTEAARELMRRAYHDDVPFDVDAGLAEVVRRAGRPVAVAVPPPSWHHPAVMRRRRRFAVAATFAAAVVTILGAGLVVSQVPAVVENRPSPAATDPFVLPSAPATEPFDLPSACAGAWGLAIVDDEFQVSSRSHGCPPLPRAQLWLMDYARGNGDVAPGDATIWPVGGSAEMVTPPYAFRLAGWGGAVPGHVYSILLLNPALARIARPGADAYQYYQSAYHISLSVFY